MSKNHPRLNQIIFIDLDYSDAWDKLGKGIPCVITKIKEEENFFLLCLLIITSQDKSQINEEEKSFISQYEIRLLPDCLRINPSFVRIHRHVNLKIAKSKLSKFLCNKCPKGCFKKYKNLKNNLVDEYEFLVKKHEDYINDKLNISKLRQPIEVEMD